MLSDINRRILPSVQVSIQNFFSVIYVILYKVGCCILILFDRPSYNLEFSFIIQMLLNDRFHLVGEATLIGLSLNE